MFSMSFSEKSVFFKHTIQQFLASIGGKTMQKMMILFDCFLSIHWFGRFLLMVGWIIGAFRAMCKLQAPCRGNLKRPRRYSSKLVGRFYITTISHFSIPFVLDNMFHPNFHDDIIQHRNKSNHPIAQGCARYFARLTQISMSRWQGESYDQGRREWPKGPKGRWRLLEWFPEIKSW